MSSYELVFFLGFGYAPPALYHRPIHTPPTPKILVYSITESHLLLGRIIVLFYCPNVILFYLYGVCIMIYWLCKIFIVLCLVLCFRF